MKRKIRRKTLVGAQMYGLLQGGSYAYFTQGDSSAPVISNIQVINITETSVTITWDTDEESTSVVNYGLTSSYTDQESDSALVTSHSVTITGLTAGTTYHFSVTSIDASNNSASSIDSTFDTLNITETLFGDGAPQVGSIDTFETNITLGTKIRFAVDGQVLALRMWKPNSANVGYGLRFYNNIGTLLASATVEASTDSEVWKEVTLNTPVDVTANTIYVAAYTIPNGNYLGANNFFNNALVNGNIEGLDTDESPNGVFNPGDVFPTQTFESSSYFADVRFRAN
jgi:hypothetical protein